jgi:hypothetical protein
MYKKNFIHRTSITLNQSLQGETIEQKIQRIVTNGEPIKDGAPLIYTDSKDGVQAGYNIRTDRFEIAVEGMDKIVKSNIAKREHKAKMEIVKDDIGGTEPTQGTGTDK